MLMGVTSNRVDVKRRGALAERQLERRAEPFAALFLPPADVPDRLLELAWREMVRNSAHDSICACSVDDVVDAVLHRYAEARNIAAGLADRAVKALARSLSEPGPTVLNPSPRARSGVVELVVPADGPAAGGRPGALGAHRACPGPWCSTPTRCAPSSACSRDPRSTTTPGCTTSGSRTPRRASTSRSPSAPRSGPTCPSPRPSRTSTPGSGPAPTPWSAWPWTSRRPGGSWPGPAEVPGYGWPRLRAGARWSTRSR